MNSDPLLTDPENLDFRLNDLSPAKGYGCETYYIPEKYGIEAVRNYTDIISVNNSELGGILTENTLIDADTVIVTEDITVSNGITLRIEAGTVMLFTGPYFISVEGTLVSEGSPETRIIFTSSDPDKPGDYNNYENSWRGIRFDRTLSTNDSSFIRYSVLEYAKSVVTGADTVLTQCSGGALYINDFSKIKIENNIFRYNTAVYGAAVAAFNNCQPEINNNLFYENYAYHNGPAAYFVNSYPYFYNNTVVNNVITDINPDYQMGAVYCFRSKPLFANNIIRDNETGEFPQIYFYKEYFMHNNNISGFSGFNGNIDSDPLFDPSSDLTGVLLEKSPCIDAGTDMNLDQPQKDIMGNGRISGSSVDIGAFEYNGTFISELPERPGLLEIYPNPANPSATISFETGDENSYVLYVYDSKGRRVLYEEGRCEPFSKKKLTVDLKERPSGLYFVRIMNSKKYSAGKLMLMK